MADLCEYDDCDKTPTHCAGHFQAEVDVGTVLHHQLMNGQEIMRGLLITLEREGYDNASMAAARVWLK